MKITINENGSLSVNGEGNTVIYKKTEAGIVLKNGGFFTDFVEIEGGLKDVMHEIKNFVFFMTLLMITAML
jgi:hypothetical protein